MKSLYQRYQIHRSNWELKKLSPVDAKKRIHSHLQLPLLKLFKKSEIT